ncbi:long-chain fatty acid outer membrane transporter [compost metagenome]
MEVDTDALGNASTTADRRYKDTWHLSLGAQNQINEQWRWNVGVGYDTSAVDDEDRTVDNPMGENWRLATGVNYALDANTDLHFAYTLVWLGDLPDQQTKKTGGSVSGEYSNAALHMLGGGVVWRF